MRCVFSHKWIAIMIAILAMALAATAAYVNQPYLEMTVSDGRVCGNWVFVQLKDGYTQSDH